MGTDLIKRGVLGLGCLALGVPCLIAYWLINQDSRENAAQISPYDWKAFRREERRRADRARCAGDPPLGRRAPVEIPQGLEGEERGQSGWHPYSDAGWALGWSLDPDQGEGQESTRWGNKDRGNP